MKSRSPSRPPARPSSRPPARSPSTSHSPEHPSKSSTHAQAKVRGSQPPAKHSHTGTKPGRRPGSPAGKGGRPAAAAAPARNSSGGREPRSRSRWVIGIHSVEEALRVRPTKAEEIWFKEDFLSSQALREIADKAQRSRIKVTTKSLAQLDQLGSGHQGVAIAMSQTPELNWDSLKTPGKKIVLVLDGIEDVHNLGSVLRTAWLTGVVGVLIPADRAVGLTPSVCKIASGGAEHVPVDAHTNLPSVLQDLKDAGFWIYGLSEKGASLPWQLKLPEKVAWVIGSEGSGIRIPTERACDELVRIPQVSTGSSYNASIATSMALMETCRQFDHLK